MGYSFSELGLGDNVNVLTSHQKKKQVALNTRNLDPEVRKRFKILCAEDEISMQDAVILLIEEALERGYV